MSRPAGLRRLTGWMVLAAGLGVAVAAADAASPSAPQSRNVCHVAQADTGAHPVRGKLTDRIG